MFLAFREESEKTRAHDWQMDLDPFVKAGKVTHSISREEVVVVIRLRLILSHAEMIDTQAASISHHIWR